MMLHPTNPSRERILIVGGFGSGKSFSWIRIAQWLEKTGSDAKVYVLFTDFSMERYLEGWEHPNVVALEAGDYDEMMAAVKQFKAKARRDDWLVVDLISDPWAWVQDKVAEKTAGKSFSEWVLDTRTTGGMAGAHGQNWGDINGLYRDFMMKYVLRFPGHVLATARAKDLMADKNGKILNEAEEIVGMFGRFMVKPEGQKDLPFQFHTVLYLQDAGNKGYRINTIRERTMPGTESTRVKLVGEPIQDFALNYLVKVAGWKL